MSTSDPIRILHVDDEPDFAAMAAEFLEREDDRFDVDPVTSAREGLDHLTEDSYDCVVSDYDMPGQNGLEFLETVREKHGGLPFILFTGKGSEEVASDAIAAGVTDYLRKEGSTDQYPVLANRIRNVVSARRSAQEAEQEHHRLQQTLKAVPACVVQIDRDGQFMFATDRAEEVLGLRPDEVSEWTYNDPEWNIRDLDGDSIPDEQLPFRQVRDSGEPIYGFRHTIEWPDGTRKALLVNGAPLFDDSGDVKSTIFALTDITDRREREQELERYETILQALGDPVYALDPDGNFTFVNDTWVEKSGYDPEQIIGEHASTVVPEETVKRGRAVIADLLDDENQRRATWETIRITADGERVPYENRIALLPCGEGDEFRGTAGVLRDISQRKKRERRVTALHETTRKLVNADSRTEVAEIISTAATEILNYPNNVVRLIDEDGDRLVPVAVTDRVHKELGERPAYPVGEGTAGEAYARGEPLVYENVSEERGDGLYEHTSLGAMYLPIDNHGSITVVDLEEIGAFDESDVELANILAANAETALDRIARTQELERQNEQLDKFASVVSHDLRNPLNVATGRLELAREDCDNEHLEGVARSHARMEAMIDDLLTLAQKGNQISSTDLIDLSDISEECWGQVDTTNARLDVETDRSVTADRVRLKQMLENLMRNAVEHGGENVTVTVGDLDDGFYIADDGSGIPEDERGRVIEPGYSMSAAGTGSGLAIVKEIVDAHGWEITVTESENGGTRVEISGVKPASTSRLD